MATPMDAGLRDILRNCAIAEPSNDQPSTFVTLYGPASRWNTAPGKATDFWLNLCRHVHLTLGPDGDKDAAMCLAEMPQRQMPVIVDAIWKYEATSQEQLDNLEVRLYPGSALHHMVHIWQEVINEQFIINQENRVQQLAVVLRSDNWLETSTTGRQLVCTAVRIQFPYARVDAQVQMTSMRSRAIQMLRSCDIFSTGHHYSPHPIGDPEEWIRNDLGKTPITMYGSSNDPKRPKLELEYIWRYIPDPTMSTGFVDPHIDIERAFKTNNHTAVLNKTVNMDQLLPYIQHSGMHWLLPMILSIDHWPDVLHPRETDVDHGQMPLGFSPQRDFTNVDENQMELRDIDVAEQLLSMINPARYQHVNYFVDIGKACYSADNGGDNGRLVWTTSAMRAVANLAPQPAFMLRAGGIEQTCRSLYNTFDRTKNEITYLTLQTYAKQDNKDLYAKWHNDICLAAMKRAIKDPFDHSRVVEAFHKMYSLEFVCQVGNGSSGATGRWFHFEGHRWVENPGGTKLRTMMSNEFRKKFEHAAVAVAKNIRTGEANQQQRFGGRGRGSNPMGESENQMNNIYKLTCLLGTVSYKNNLMRECMDQFSMPNFTELLDMNSRLTGIVNGVCEIVDKIAIFRPGKPEDYISMCTSVPLINYKDGYQDHLVAKTLRWLSQTFNAEGLLVHFLKFAASGLIGGNPDKIFAIMTGTGDNSKSMIIKLFEAVFGVYSIKLPVSMLFEKIANSSGPSPHLARGRATRFAFLDEPEDDITLQKGVIKRFTGGDSFFARKLMENGGDIKATFKMVLVCNKVPTIPNADKAIKSRVKLFPYLSSWVDHPPLGNRCPRTGYGIFKKDTDFENSIPEMAPAFLYILFNYFTTYAKDGMKVDPPIVAETTGKYWENQDIYRDFLAETTQPVFVPGTNEIDSSVGVSLRDMYNEFKMWHKESYPSVPIPNRCFFRTELTRQWGEMAGNGWYGYRLTVDDDQNNKRIVSAAPEQASIYGGKTVVAPAPFINWADTSIPVNWNQVLGGSQVPESSWHHLGTENVHAGSTWNQGVSASVPTDWQNTTAAPTNTPSVATDWQSAAGNVNWSPLPGGVSAATPLWKPTVSVAAGEWPTQSTAGWTEPAQPATGYSPAQPTTGWSPPAPNASVAEWATSASVPATQAEWNSEEDEESEEWTGKANVTADWTGKSSAQAEHWAVKPNAPSTWGAPAEAPVPQTNSWQHVSTNTLPANSWQTSAAAPQTLFQDYSTPMPTSSWHLPATSTTEQWTQPTDEAEYLTEESAEYDSDVVKKIAGFYGTPQRNAYTSQPRAPIDYFSSGPQLVEE